MIIIMTISVKISCIDYVWVDGSWQHVYRCVNSVIENKSYNNCIDQGVANMCLFDLENYERFCQTQWSYHVRALNTFGLISNS